MQIPNLLALLLPLNFKQYYTTNVFHLFTSLQTGLKYQQYRYPKGLEM